MVARVITDHADPPATYTSRTMLPSGVVALLMTAVEGSTDGWNASPQEMDAAVAALDDDISARIRAVAHEVRW